jgi:hypothetical protein
MKGYEALCDCSYDMLSVLKDFVVRNSIIKKNTERLWQENFVFCRIWQKENLFISLNIIIQMSKNRKTILFCAFVFV